MNSFFRNILHTKMLAMHQDSIRSLYNQIKYGKKYKELLCALKDIEDPHFRSIYERFKAFEGNALSDMKQIDFPYAFVDRYKECRINGPYRDEDGYCFVLHKGKRLYGQLSWNEGVLARYYNGLLIEQDQDSAHSYFRGCDYDKTGETVADLGAAEGIFGLEVVEQAKRLYLFECSKEWIEPLKKTFSPWKDKVVIVQKYIASKTTDTTVSLDDYFADLEIDFLKADIEGAEIDMIKGGHETFAKLSHALICLYHRHSDEEEITELLKNLNYEIDINPHYMVFLGDSDKGINDPLKWIRHGVVHAINKR